MKKEDIDKMKKLGIPLISWIIDELIVEIVDRGSYDDLININWKMAHSIPRKFNRMQIEYEKEIYDLKFRLEGLEK